MAGGVRFDGLKPSVGVTNCSCTEVVVMVGTSIVSHPYLVPTIMQMLV